MIYSFIGRSGCGKDTQIEKLKDYLNVPNISTGQVLRQLYEEGDKDGIEASKYWKNGLWVEDDLMMRILKRRIEKPDCKRGFILNGFPRTLEQAKEYDVVFKDRPLDNVVYFDITEDEAVKRLSNRRYCPGCGATFHNIYKKPQVRGVCDNCGSKLIQREDDKEDIIRNRLKSMRETVKAILDFYKQTDRLIVIDAMPSIEEIHKDLLDKLGLVEN